MDRKKFLDPTPDVSDNFMRAFKNLKMSDSMSMPHQVPINDMLFGNNFGGGNDSDDEFAFEGKGALPDEDEELRQAIMLSMQSTNVEFLNREGGLFAGGQSTTAQTDEEVDWAEEIRRIEEATKREEEKLKLSGKNDSGTKSSGSDSPKDKSTSSSSAVDNSSSSVSGKIVSPRRKESKDKSKDKDKKEKEKKSKDKSSATKDKSKDKTKDKKEKKDKK